MSTSKSNTLIEYSESLTCGQWRESDHNLLQCAERHGVQPAYGCRRGFCGSCKVTIERGEVQQLVSSGIDLAEDEVLLCCSIPISAKLILSC